MYEKNKASNILLVFAIIVIIAMGYFVYKFYNEKTKAIQEIKNLENTVQTLQNKIENISKVINSSNAVNVNNANNSNSATLIEQNNNTSINTNEFKENNYIGKYKKTKCVNIEDSAMCDYIVLQEKTFYLTNDLNSNNILALPGTYQKDANNNILFMYSSQDFAFFSAASARLETVNGKINIILENGNEVMYFEKID